MPSSPRRAVALTFDDGPGPHTAAVLEVLAAYDVRATFFVTGAHVAADPATAARVVAAGHLLGNHTYTHPQDVPGSVPRGHFDELPEDEQGAQIDDTTAAIVDATGQVPRFFRGPGGRHFAATTGRLARKRGLSVAHWTVDTGDWDAPARLDRGFQDSMVAAVRAAGAGGTSGSDPAPCVVLMHDAKASAEPEHELPSFRGNTVAALPRIIELLDGAVFTDPDGHVL